MTYPLRKINKKSRIGIFATVATAIASIDPNTCRSPESTASVGCESGLDTSDGMQNCLANDQPSRGPRRGLRTNKATIVVKSLIIFIFIHIYIFLCIHFLYINRENKVVPAVIVRYRNDVEAGPLIVKEPDASPLIRVTSSPAPLIADVNPVYNPLAPPNTSAQSNTKVPNNADVSLEHNLSIRPNKPAQSNTSVPNDAVVSLEHNLSIRPNTPAQSNTSVPNIADVSLKNIPSSRPNTPAQSNRSVPKHADVSLEHSQSNTPAQSSASGPNKADVSLKNIPSIRPNTPEAESFNSLDLEWEHEEYNNK